MLQFRENSKCEAVPLQKMFHPRHLVYEALTYLCDFYSINLMRFCIENNNGVGSKCKGKKNTSKTSPAGFNFCISLICNTFMSPFIHLTLVSRNA
jgi:hypothetical protein